MRKNRIVVILLAGLLGALGCSGGKPVDVKVTLDGKPLEGATVSLVIEGGGQPVNGSTDSSGVARLTGSQGKGVNAGTYKVLVTKTTPIGKGELDPKSADVKSMMMKGSAGAKSELPPVYGDPGRTPLSLKVPPDTSPTPLDLKSKP
jgi:hypothetical protein